jgi:hypothetical protein
MIAFSHQIPRLRRIRSRGLVLYIARGMSNRRKPLVKCIVSSGGVLAAALHHRAGGVGRSRAMKTSSSTRTRLLVSATA